MVTFKVNEATCKGCGLCINACPKKLLEPAQEVTAKGYRVARMSDAAQCIACAACAKTCPDACIEIWKE